MAARFLIVAIVAHRESCGTRAIELTPNDDESSTLSGKLVIQLWPGPCPIFLS